MNRMHTEPTAENIAEAAKAAILRDARDGAVPREVSSFEELQEHVDANTYLAEAVSQDVFDAEGAAGWPRFNAAIEIIHEWLAAGGLRGPS